MKIQIVVATGNENKVREIQEIMQEETTVSSLHSNGSNGENKNICEFVVMSMKQLGIHSDPEENGKTFEENALIKARACAGEIERQPELFKTLSPTAFPKGPDNISISESVPSQLPTSHSFKEKNDNVNENSGRLNFLIPATPIVVLADDSGLVVDALGGAPGIYSARYMGRDTSYTLKMQHIMDELDRLGAEGTARSARFVCACAAVFPHIDTQSQLKAEKVLLHSDSCIDKQNPLSGLALTNTSADIPSDSVYRGKEFNSVEEDFTFLQTVPGEYSGRKEIVVTGTMEGEIAHEIRGANGFGYDPFFFLPEYGKTSAELTEEEKNAISHRGKAFSAMMKELEKIFS